MKILYNRNDEKEMNAYGPAYNGKGLNFLLAAYLPTQLLYSENKWFSK